MLVYDWMWWGHLNNQKGVHRGVCRGVHRGVCGGVHRGVHGGVCGGVHGGVPMFFILKNFYMNFFRQNG